MSGERIIVIGIGNVLLTDEGAGVAAVTQLMDGWSFPQNVEIYDGGVTGMVGLMPIIEDADHLIVLDAVNGEGPPGSVKRYSLEDFKLTIPTKLSSHDIGFVECLAIAEVNGYIPKSVVVIGVKPEDIFSWGMTPTPTVHGALDEMVRMALEELLSLGVEAAEKTGAETCS